MKLKMKLASVCIAALLTLCLLIIGVFAASQVNVDITGTVSFVAKDVHVQITGKITGTKESGDDIALSPLNYSADIVNGEPTEAELNTWKNKNLNFFDKKSVIKIEITVENLSTEREVNVKLEGFVGVDDNVNKVLKSDGNDYNSGTFVTVQPNNNKTTFTIEMNVANTNYSVRELPFSYLMTLEDENFVEESNTQSSSSVSVNVYSDEAFEDLEIVKLDADNDFIPDYLIGTNIYKAQSSFGDVYAYLDTGEYDITSKITNNSIIKFKLYLSVMSYDYVIKIGDSDVIFDETMEDDYILLSFEHKVSQDVNIDISGFISYLG